MTKRIIRLPEVQATTGLSRSSIYAGTANGTFPSQIALGARAVGWYEDEVSAWIEQRAFKAQADAALSVKKAAEELGMQSCELQPFIDSGELPSFRLGRHVLVKVAALREFKAKPQSAEENCQRLPSTKVF